MIKNKKVLYIMIPKNVQICWGNDFIQITGPLGTIIKNKGNFDLILKDSILYIITDETLSFFYYSLIRSLVLGVWKGYKCKLKLVGVGYKARVVNNTLFLKVGFSHEIQYQIPHDIKIICSKVKGILLLIKGKEEHRIRQIATEIRRLRKPDSYKGKGIHREGEILKLKKGKREGK